MAKRVETMLKTGKYTGQDVGQAMIRDLVHVFLHHNHVPCKAQPLTDAQKNALVSGLTSAADIRRYGEYRMVHDFLLTVPVIFSNYYTRAELCAEKIYWPLFYCTLGEGENRAVQGEPLPPPDSRLPFWRTFAMAEKALLACAADFLFLQEQLYDALSECFARKKGLELMGEFLDIPEITALISRHDFAMADKINRQLQKLLGQIVRYGAAPFEKDARQVKLEILAVLPPVDLSRFEPTEQAVEAARKSLTFSTFQGNAEALYARLKRSVRP